MTGLLLMGVLLVTLPVTQGPVSRLSDARLAPATDTMDTWDRQGDQPRRKGAASYIQALSRLPSGDWQIRREWRDSLGTVTSVGTTVLSARDLATRFDGRHRLVGANRLARSRPVVHRCASCPSGVAARQRSAPS